MYELINQMFKDHFSPRNYSGNNMVDQQNDLFEGRTENDENIDYNEPYEPEERDEND